MVFALFGLLLGLAVAELLTGFAHSWKARLRAESKGIEPVRVGWLVPLLGLLVIMDQTAFWLYAWSLRDAIPLTFLSLLAVLAVVGGYYLLATFVFPDDPDAWRDYDDYYLRTNRLIVGGILVINFSVVGLAALLEGGSGEIWAAERRGPVADAALMLAVPTTIALFFVKSKRANLVLLVLLNALVLLEAVAGAGGW